MLPQVMAEYPPSLINYKAKWDKKLNDALLYFQEQYNSCHKANIYSRTLEYELEGEKIGEIETQQSVGGGYCLCRPCPIYRYEMILRYRLNLDCKIINGAYTDFYMNKLLDVLKNYGFNNVVADPLTWLGENDVEKYYSTQIEINCSKYLSNEEIDEISKDMHIRPRK